MLILAIVLSIANYMTYKTALVESRKFIYAIDKEGEIIPLRLIEDRENIEIEIQHHIEMFVDNFYSLDQHNVHAKVEKARWLADVRKWYDLRLNKNFYNEIKDFQIRYSANIVDLSIVRSDNRNYNFTMTIEIKRSDISQSKTLLYTSGNIILTDRNYPHNPHGLFIENYTEQRKEIINE